MVQVRSDHSPVYISRGYLSHMSFLSEDGLHVVRNVRENKANLSFFLCFPSHPYNPLIDEFDGTSLSDDVGVVSVRRRL